MSGSEKVTLRKHRETLIPNASEKVLKIGGGTGAKLRFYGHDMESLTVGRLD